MPQISFDAPGDLAALPRRHRFDHRRARCAIAAAGVLSLLALTACEEENANVVSSPTGDTVAGEQARRLDLALMTPYDLPGGWERDFQSAPDVLTPSCEGIDLTASHAVIGRAARLTHRDEEVENMIIVFDTDADASAHMAQFSSSTTRECLAGSVQRSALEGRGIDIESLAVDLERSAPVHDADEAATFHLNADIEALGFDVSVYLDIVAVRTGRAISYFSFLEMGEAPTELQPNLLDIIVARVQAGALT